MLWESEERSEYEVQENGRLRPRLSPAYQKVYRALIDQLVAGFNLSRQEAGYVARVVVGLSMWRDERQALAVTIADLAEQPRCNGVEEWRNRGSVLYARHGVGVNCPLHGEVSGNGRLVKYVGKLAERQTAVQVAMTRELIFQQQKQQLDSLRVQIEQVLEELHRLHRFVGGV